MRGPLISRRGALVAGLALTATGAWADAAAITTIKAEDGRDVRVWVWPAQGRARGVILFSHGAMSSPEKYVRLIGPWTRAGFKVFAPLHVDSTDHPDHARYGMIDSWRARLLDMRALSTSADAPSYVAAGHSYGGLVALTLGGAAAEVPPGVTGPLRDLRATSVVAFSPPGPSPGLVTAQGYAALAVPALIETGDKDVPFNSTDGRWQAHLTAFDVAPAGDKYALVLDGVDHYFGGLICRPELPGPAQTEAFARAVDLSTLFLQAYGADDGAARSSLNQALGKNGLAKLTLK